MSIPQVVSEQINEAEDSLDASVDRLIESLENMIKLLKEQKEKRNEVPE